MCASHQLIACRAVQIIKRGRSFHYSCSRILARSYFFGKKTKTKKIIMPLNTCTENIVLSVTFCEMLTDFQNSFTEFYR